MSFKKSHCTGFVCFFVFVAHSEPTRDLAVGYIHSVRKTNKTKQKHVLQVRDSSKGLCFAV